jgi:hypothetical protein
MEADITSVIYPSDEAPVDNDATIEVPAMGSGVNNVSADISAPLSPSSINEVTEVPVSMRSGVDGEEMSKQVHEEKSRLVRKAEHSPEPAQPTMFSFGRRPSVLPEDSASRSSKTSVSEDSWSFGKPAKKSAGLKKVEKAASLVQAQVEEPFKSASLVQGQVKPFKFGSAVHLFGSPEWGARRMQTGTETTRTGSTTAEIGRDQISPRKGEG